MLDLDALEWTAGCLKCGKIGTVFSSDKIERLVCGDCGASDFMVEEDPHGTPEWLEKFFMARLKRMS
jgi:ribosomal protein S27AE